MSGEIPPKPLPSVVPLAPRPFVKDFEAWNAEKQRIEKSETVKRRYAKINEVWYVKF